MDISGIVLFGHSGIQRRNFADVVRDQCGAGDRQAFGKWRGHAGPRGSMHGKVSWRPAMNIERLLARRTDLSTFLVHLTRAGPGETAQERLISILMSRTIEARSPFGPAVQRLRNARQPTASQNCVCFTETPLEYVHILTSPIDNRTYQFAPYGIAISKKQGRRRGVNPVWYLDITPGHPWLTVPLETMMDTAIATGEYANQPIARLTPFIEQNGKGPAHHWRRTIQERILVGTRVAARRQFQDYDSPHHSLSL